MRTDMMGAAAVPAGLVRHPQHSPWQSPVPYLFGGLAAMLGVIAFALLILACSYWKLSGFLEGGDEDGRTGAGDLESGEGKCVSSGAVKSPSVFEKKFVVIMAGEVEPTFLATPVSSRSSSFGDTNKCTVGADHAIPEGDENGEKERSCEGFCCDHASVPEQSRDMSDGQSNREHGGHRES